jgi:hypothetical protein
MIDIYRLLLTNGCAVDERDQPETDLAEVVALHCDFPEWGVWFPVQGTWTAARPANTQPPAPESPMIWVHAQSAQQLAGRMRAADQEGS